VLLQTLDALWREHLVMLEHLRQVVGFRGYAQRDPLKTIQDRGLRALQAMLARLRDTVTSQMMRVEVVQRPPPLAPESLAMLQESHVDPLTGENEVAVEQDQRSGPQMRGGNGAVRAMGIVAAVPRSIRTTRRRGAGAAERALPVRFRQKYKHCHGTFT